MAFGPFVLAAGEVVPASARALLDRWGWAYSLGLLVPLSCYSLALKASSVVSGPGGSSPAGRLVLMRSDILFSLGYALFWVGLLAGTKRGWQRNVVVALFEATSALVVVVKTCAHQYFSQTGTTLSYDLLALWLPRFDQIKPMLARGTPLYAWMLLALALSYVPLGPRLLARTLARARGWPASPPTVVREASFFPPPLGLSVVGLGLGALAVRTNSLPPGTSRSLARDPFVNVVLTGLRRRSSRVVARTPAVPTIEPGTLKKGLVRTPRTERRNVVLVHLESTRAQSLTPYNEELQTTPFLYELAQSSLLVERAYTTVPHTSKAAVSVNSGILPHLVQKPTEAEPGGIPARGLAGLLREEGYRTVLFQSSTQNFDDFGALAKNLGYEDYCPLEFMQTEGFERSNYFGYEDDVMLGPSEQWLGERGQRPFVAGYLTGTAHHDYRPPVRYGRYSFSPDGLLNRYLNCIRYQDSFLRNLFAQYKDLGLYESTIFVVYGDHGEGFGEHGRYGHEDVPYEEGLRVPLLIHDPKRWKGGERIEGPASLTDVLPTVLDILGYELEGGGYHGHSLLRPLPRERSLMISCFNKDRCLVSITGSEKYIHHYGDRPDEYFELSRDPFERKSLACECPEEVGRRREELLGWHWATNAAYDAWLERSRSLEEPG